MPPRESYRDGDRLEDGQGNVGYVRDCTSKATGRKYLRVFIAEGPRKNQWEWPERFGPPSLNWPQGYLPATCDECDRTFLRRADRMEPFCLQCDRAMDARMCASYALDGPLDIESADARIERRDRDRSRAGYGDAR